MKKYSRNEAYEETLKYFDNDELATEVFLNKYALKDSESNLLEKTPKDMHQRLAKEFARIETKYLNPMSEEEIFGLFDHFKYIVPQGSPMSGIGNPYQIQSISNCFVVEPPEDSYGGICHTDEQLLQISKRRGGVGLDISNLRPKNATVENAAKTTDGIGIFMERFSNSIREVGQSGRRGALMITMSVHHPEIMTFIDIKKDLKKVTGANVSVRLTDEFMQAVKNNTDVELRWPVEDKPVKISKQVKARDIWNQLIKNNWLSAEPGILFWDNIINSSPADCYAKQGFKTISTNPCSELPLSRLDSCRLLVLNLFSYVKNPFSPQAKFDYELFSLHAKKAQRLMDDMIDLELECINKIIDKIEKDPEANNLKKNELELWEKVKKACQNGRRTGTGITALGDTLAAINIKFGSEKSVTETEKIYKTLAVSAYASSCQMAKERGAFPVFDKTMEKDHIFINRILNEFSKEELDLYQQYGRRNIALLTTAPTGSVSIVTQTTSGIEPVYMLSYMRRRKINSNDFSSKTDFTDQLGDKWQEYNVHHNGLTKWMNITGETDIKKSPYWGATSAEIDWIKSVELQAAAQKWVCHAISRTINLPKEAAPEMIDKIYIKAWESGLKGCTIYRDGSRTGVLISNEEKQKEIKTLQQHHAPKRPKELECDILQVRYKNENWAIIIGKYSGCPYEIFAGLAKYIEIPKKIKNGVLIKNGKDKDGISTYNLQYGKDEDMTTIKDVAKVFENPTFGALTRMVSLTLRHGTPVQFIVEQLQKDQYSDITSFSKVVARVLKQYIPEGTKSSTLCEQCKSDQVVFQEGCHRCLHCLFSKCG